MNATPLRPPLNGTMQVSNWKGFQKNTLQGFFSLELLSGMIVHGLTLHSKNDSRWVGMPAREYVKENVKSWARP